jgi:hypothetical protein
VSEEELIEGRTNSVLADWPTLKHAWGCVNCEALFREPVQSRCPHCRSESVFDAAAVLATERVPMTEVVQQALGMIHSLEEAISESHNK